MTEYYSVLLRIFFSNDVDSKINIDPLLHDYRSNSVVLFIPDLFFFEYHLRKVGPLRPVLKAAELLSLALAVAVLVNHLTDLNDLEKDENIILALVYTPDLIT